MKKSKIQILGNLDDGQRTRMMKVAKRLIAFCGLDSVTVSASGNDEYFTLTKGKKNLTLEARSCRCDGGWLNVSTGHTRMD